MTDASLQGVDDLETVQSQSSLSPKNLFQRVS